MIQTRRYDNVIGHEQIRILFEQSRFVFMGIVFVMLVVLLFMWERADRDLLLGWATANLGLTIARVVMVRRFHRLKPQGRRIVAWGLLFALTSTLSGLLWGSIAVFLMQPDQYDSVLLITLVLAGMSAGALVPLSSFLPAYVGFSSMAMLPLALVMFLSDTNVLLYAGYLVLAFLGVNLGYAVNVNRNLAASIRLRFENLHLLEDLRAEKERAEKANTDKSRFLAATSHDLRQPLHAMDLYLGALENLLSDEDQLALLGKSRTASSALNGLLTALMDISRLDAGEVSINREVVNIRSLLENIAEEFAELAGKARIVISVEAPALLADSDPVMLNRLLRNLISNACKHSEASRITLRAEERGEAVELTIRDDGKGIPFAEQEKVFSEFYQLNNPERDRNKGLGLGLAIVRRLADLLQHDLTLLSKPGEGCCFRVCLPGILDRHGNMETAEQKTVVADISGLFVILIEDEAGVRDAMRVLLRQWGCELLVVDGVESLQEALQAAAYPQPDLVISDYRLRRNTTGLQAVEAVHGHFSAAVPAIIISGDTGEKVESRVQAAGHALLHKPVPAALLRQAIASSAVVEA